MNKTAAIITALLAFTVAGCRNSRDPLNAGAVNVSTYSPDGAAVVTSYAGRTSAGGGQVTDTTEVEVLKALAEKVDGQNFTYASATRSSIDQPNVAIEQEIDTKHKAALQDAAQALAAGASGNYAKAAAEAASLGSQLIAARAAKANAPKPDSGAITTRVLASGPANGETAQLMAVQFGETLRAGARSTYGLDSKTLNTDTTSPADFDAIGKVAVELAKLQAEIAKAKAAASVPTKPAAPPIVKPDAPASTNASPAKVAYDKLAKPQFLYKTRLEKRNPVTRHDAAILIPKDRPAPVSVSGTGQTIAENYFSTSEDRWIIRLAGPLPAQSAVATIAYKDGGTEQFKIEALNSRTEYKPGPYKQAGAVDVPDAPTVPLLNDGPTPIPPAGALFETTPNSLTLRADFAAAVGKVDALANIVEPGNPNPIIIQAVRSGNTWTLPQSLESYQRGNVPNTWRIRLNKTPPAGVTYHTSIMQSFVRVGDNDYGPGNKTFPPTIRK